ncbi:MAG: 16S rRNA (guanine(527)-N(7))-methyltransferase RsmG [Burkholderiales bacterium]
MSVAQGLAAGLAALGIDMPESDQLRLNRYVGLIEKWNKVHNLTAIRAPQQMLAHHLLDSLAILPYLGAARSLVDVGSGAGLPGIPLAIALPELAVTLVDSNHKRHAFQKQCKAELVLNNTTVVHRRVEDYRSEFGFDVVISRAFSDLGEFIRAARHLCAKGGSLLAMKGLYPHEEIAKLPDDARVVQVTELQVPGLDANRHLLVIQLS